MIVNLRYHIASLAAVFLALGIGILIGTTLLGDKPIIDETNRMLSDIRSKLNNLEKKNEESQTVISSYEESNGRHIELEKKVLPLLIKQKLIGTSVAVINTTGDDDQYKDLVSVLTKAGAKVESNITIENNLSLSEIDNKDELLQKLNIVEKDENKIISSIITQLTNAIFNPKGNEIISYLNDKELIRVKGRFGVPIKAVVIIGGNNEEVSEYFDNIDKPIIKSLLQNKVQVVGVESTNIPYSYIKNYQKLGLSTIDNIDTVPGQIALIHVISGKKGNYGIKSTADNFLPDLE